VIAGPTCDSADVLYDKTDYHLPLALTAGDRVEFLTAGAYTTTYAAVGFNGFAPLREFFVGGRSHAGRSLAGQPDQRPNRAERPASSA
jgi:ornithine decarboxylase